MLEPMINTRQYNGDQTYLLILEKLKLNQGRDLINAYRKQKSLL